MADGSVRYTSSLKQFNNGDTFIFKYYRVIFKSWICSLTERQKGPTVLKSFLNVLEESGQKPTKDQTDTGVEFTSRAFKSTLKKQNIHFDVIFSENKATVV